MEISTVTDLSALDSQLLSAQTDFVALSAKLKELSDSGSQSNLMVCLLLEARLRILSVMITEKVFEKSGKDPDMEQFRGGKQKSSDL